MWSEGRRTSGSEAGLGSAAQAPGCWLACLSNHPGAASVSAAPSGSPTYLLPEAPPTSSSSLCEVRSLLSGLDAVRSTRRVQVLTNSSPSFIYPSFCPTVGSTDLWQWRFHPQRHRQQLSINFFARSPNHVRSKINLWYDMTCSDFAFLVEPPGIHRTFYLKFTNKAPRHHFSFWR